MGVLKSLLSWPTIASKNWVYRQYDHMVRDGTSLCPGSDAAVLRIKADSLPASAADPRPDSPTLEKYIALTVDGNADPAFTFTDQFGSTGYSGAPALAEP